MASTYYRSPYSGEEIDAAIAKAHTHSNRGVLESIPSAGGYGSVLFSSGFGNLEWRKLSLADVSEQHVESGVTNAVELGNTTTVWDITFAEPFQNVPIVMVCLESSNTTYRLGQCAAAVVPGSVTETGMQVRASSASGTSYKVSCAVRWVAMEL